MPNVWRVFRPFLFVVLALALVVPAAYAQDDGESTGVVIQGTLELETLVSAIRDAYLEDHASAQVQIDPGGGLRAGFDALCTGDVDIVMSNEPISDLQIQACANTGTDFIETVIAYEAVVFLASTAADVQCVSQETLDEIWQLGAPAEVTWDGDLLATTLDGPVTFYGPDTNSNTYLLFRRLLPAGDLREEIVTTTELANILEKVQEEDSDALAYLSLADLEALDPDGTVVPLEVEDASFECIPPLLSTLENRTYPYARTAYLYVNAGSAQMPETQAFMEFVLADENGAAAVAAEQGYSVPTTATYEFGWNNIQTGNVGRTFTRPLTPVEIPTTEAGIVTVAGTSLLGDLSDSIFGTFTDRYINADVEIETLGNSAGWEAFCSGAADVFQTTRAATGDELALCEENGITPYTLELGYDALVFAVPAANDWLECLDADTAAQIFAAGTEDAPAPAAWSDINANWPDSDVLLVVPPLRTGETDYMTFNLIGDLSFLMRDDATPYADPLYRAQGVANTDNGLTYLLWSDLQNSEADVRLVPVDGGDGCTAPEVATFEDGTYPLSYPIHYVFSDQSLDLPLVRAFMWNFFMSEAQDVLADYAFVGFDLAAFGDATRDEVFDMLAAYEDAAAEGEEPAAEEGGEAEPVATEEPDAEATEEPEAEPTAEAEPEATEEATEEPAPDVTDEAAPEPTDEATEEAGGE